MAGRLNALARRVEGDGFFLASALADYARGERLGEGELAAVLGCPPEVLTPLRLCRRPHGDASRFRRDVDRIAAQFGIAPEVLAQVLRRSDAITALGAGAESGLGTLMAARDRTDHGGDTEAGAPA
jgi:hypothetical protein